MNKKAALELSINAIVIVILAMTLLGLGLGFVRNMFTDITDTTTKVQDNMEQQILDDLRRGDKKISFPTDEIKIQRGSEEILAIGVKNTQASELNFGLMLWVKNTDGEQPIPTDESLTAADDIEAFFWDNALQTLGPGDDKVYGVKLASSRSASGTRLYKIKIVEQSDAGPVIGHPVIGQACEDGVDTSLLCNDELTQYLTCSGNVWIDGGNCLEDNPVYASEDFFVKII